MIYKILVVDDESHYADMLRDLLLQNNFIADMVTSVQQALDALDTQEYALIIADFKMPGMDGAEFLQRVRQRNTTIPFFMVSGLMNTHELIRVANLGATLVFEKPLEIASFMEAVKKYVSPLSDAEFQKKFRGDLTGETYPEELTHLADKSPLGHDFVQRLWTAFRHESYAIVPLRPGSEIEPIAREVSRWKGRSQGEFYTLTPEILASPDCVEALNAVIHDPAVAPVLIVNEIESATDEQLFLLAEFLRGRHIAPALNKELFFLILPDATHAGPPLAKRNTVLGAFIKGKKITLAPLRERPADVAWYVKRIIARLTENSPTRPRGWFAPDALGLLLQHDWPGEYDELVAKLTAIAALDHAAPLHAPELATLLEEAAELPPEGYTLARRLHLAQSRALDAALDATGGDRLSALLAIGVPPDIAESAPAGGLFYPELLK